MGSPRQGWDAGQVMSALSLQVLAAEVLPWAPLLVRASPRCFLAGMGAGDPLLRISPGAAPAEMESTRTPCTGRGDGVSGGAGIATPRNATGQPGIVGSSSCPGCVHNHHVDPHDLPEQMGCLGSHSLPTKSSDSAPFPVSVGLSPPHGESWG